MRRRTFLSCVPLLPALLSRWSAFQEPDAARLAALNAEFRRVAGPGVTITWRSTNQNVPPYSASP